MTTGGAAGRPQTAGGYIVGLSIRLLPRWQLALLTERVRAPRQRLVNLTLDATTHLR